MGSPIPVKLGITRVLRKLLSRVYKCVRNADGTGNVLDNGVVLVGLPVVDTCPGSGTYCLVIFASAVNR